jgi:hypothetical protein
VGLKGGYDNAVCNTLQHLLPALMLNGWVRIDDYVNVHGLVAIVRTTE